MSSIRRRLFGITLLWMLAVIVVVMLGVHLFIEQQPSRQRRVTGHYTAIFVTAAGFIAGGLMMVSKGLAPLRQLRERLAAVRKGQTQSVDGDYPTEVQPLVDDLNALLDDRDRAITRAHATAGDLAHGLKTPLAVLAHEAQRAEAAGQHELASTLRQQVDRMHRQVEYHLARSRATASAGAAPGVRSSVRESVEALARTMLRLHADRGITIDVRIEPEHTVRVNREDLDEMLGNLLDNACKWARSRVVVTCHGGSFAVSAAQDDTRIVINVDDDGAGLHPEMRDAVLQRGVRADEAAPGSGLGLAIVRDLAELYGGSIVLDRSSSGGVSARLELPAS